MATRPQPAQTPPDKPRGANRSTKVAQKLKVLPEQPDPATQSTIKLPEPVKSPEAEAALPTIEEPSADDEADSEDEGEVEQQDVEDVEVYNAIAQIPAGTARNDALRLTKRKAKSLPRVTAYCTATSYRMQDLMKFFSARRHSNRTNARVIDNVIYTPYVYDPPPLASAKNPHPDTGDLLGVPELAAGPSDSEGVAASSDTKAKGKRRTRFDKAADLSVESELYVFEFGVTVAWGFTAAQEKRFLATLKRFEVEKLPPDEIEMEDLNFYYADHYSRIYNDVITLRKGSSFMTKLALSHALAQSAKISLFEELISTTIEQTKDIPEAIAETGHIGMPHSEILRQIGRLFILRMNLNLVGSVLDSPEVFWSFPDLQPLYDAARSYLEIPQRINLLNNRVEVLQDMLQLLKESVSSRHAERLETIVIVLIVIEILLGVITVLVDLFSG